MDMQKVDMYIIDWFTISKKAKETNFNRLMTLI